MSRQDFYKINKMKKIIKVSTTISLFVLAAVLVSFSTKRTQETKVKIMTFHETYVTADLDKGGQLFGNRKDVKEWEKFTIVDLGEGKVAIKASNNKYVTVNNEGKLFARALVAQEHETFTKVAVQENWVAFKAYNGKYVVCDKDKKYELIASRDNVQEWESFNLMPLE
jgi:hypothetical protein